GCRECGRGDGGETGRKEFLRRAFPEYSGEQPLWNLSVEEVWALLGTGSLEAPEVFRSLAVAEMAEIVGHGAVVEYQAGERVFGQGEISNALFVLISGAVEVSVSGAQGPSGLARLGAGDAFGEMGFVAGPRRTATISVLEPTRLIVVTRSALDRLERTNPVLAGRVLRRLFGVVARRLADANRRSRAMA